MRYLVTGHTGFKGYWLSALLRNLGHEVTGLALEPENGSLYSKCSEEIIFSKELFVDIRDRNQLDSAIESLNPDFIFHLAAQPLVSESYRDPIGTIETNINGTLNVLEASRKLPNLKGQVIVTTDKVYKNTGATIGYVESDPLGGHDIYSASKAASDLITQAHTVSFPSAPTAIARAGNVIGGGDHSKDRLLPDIIRSLNSDKPILLRNPSAVRPWQHVLDCLWGYYLLSEDVKNNPGQHSPNSTWNFGPDAGGFIKVDEILEYINSVSSNAIQTEIASDAFFKEAKFLTLDSTKSNGELGWFDKLKFPESIDWTLNWHRRVNDGESPATVVNAQISEYLQRVR